LRILRQNNLRDIWEIVRQRPERAAIFTGTLFSILLVSLSSYVILLIESEAPDGNIQTPGQALWWSIVTITTVGYGDYYPTTDNGRLIAIVLMLVGIGTFSAFTSYLATSFINRGRNRSKEDETEDIAARLAAVEAQLQTLTEAIQRLMEKEK
jgi:voltage-gated potassium channel